MVDSKNMLFWDIYNKAKEKAVHLSGVIINSFEFGTCAVSINKRDTLLYILDYLEIIKNSKYTYYHIDGLTKISNILKKI